ncbi:hypothetical protein HYV89_02810 [Candidatus Woesearchaeota archaeon]|nr:hypothetical protein [Candidatus Woesearchaeota archaeon]
MPRKPKDQVEKEIEAGDRDEDIYTEEGREVAEDEDVITDAEEGFMEGYEEDERAAKCAKCKKILEEDFIEEEIDDEEYRFCSRRCAETFKKAKED